MITPGRARSGSVIGALTVVSDEISWINRRILESGPVVAERTVAGQRVELFYVYLLLTEVKALYGDGSIFTL